MQSGDNYFRMKEGIQIGWPPVVKLLLKKRGGSLWYSFTGPIANKYQRQEVENTKKNTNQQEKYQPGIYDTKKILSRHPK